MTYCLALRLDEGLIFLADTRTNAGVDNVSTYRKQHVIRAADDRLFVLQSAGNLATTQEVLDRIERDLASPDAPESLATVRHLFEAALYIGRLGQEVVAAHRDGLGAVGADATATFLLGARSPASAPTCCWSTRRATTSGRRTSDRSSRSARASTASSCSSSPCTPACGWRRRRRSRSARW
ncbi:MAG: hypothetical protein R2702_15035 [Acidimicrobiales bacterium]